MVYGEQARPLLKKYREAREQESAYAQELHDTMLHGDRNFQELKAMADKLDAAHARAMAIYQELQKHREGS